MQGHLGIAKLGTRLVCTLFTICLLVRPFYAQKTDASGFSFKGDLWPSASFPIGTPQEIAIFGQVRNDFAQGASWKGYDPDSGGFGQLRLLGQSMPICETVHKGNRFGNWTANFDSGTSIPILVKFDRLFCATTPAFSGSLEARACVNPNMFELSNGEDVKEVCSAWVKVTLDPTTAAIRHGDAALREQFQRMMRTGQPSDQQLAYEALLVRSHDAAPSTYELETIPMGNPDIPLAQLWLEFFHAEAVTIKTLTLTAGPPPSLIVSPPNGCEPRPNDPNACAGADPDVNAQYKRDIAENDRRMLAHNRLAQLQRDAQESIADFGLYMGSHYRKNPAAREELYVQAYANGLDENQLSQLRRFVEFASK